MTFIFLGGNTFELSDVKDIEKIFDTYPDLKTVILNNETELNILLRLIGIEKVHTHKLKTKAFSSYWDLSNVKFPKFNETQFDLFYEDWLKMSQRENTMDEYGQLLFLQSLSYKWNELTYRMIIREKEAI